MCYEVNSNNECGDGMHIVADAEERTGYRLPTEAAWEYSCRAGAMTRYPFGDSGSLLKLYAWYRENSNDSVHSTGSLMPNDLGLFDMMGNVSEWCQIQPHALSLATYDFVDFLNERRRIFNISPFPRTRGGDFTYFDGNWRVSFQMDQATYVNAVQMGFRTARTMP
jgi:formylglycine-generating enzyme required for sulfatase activity